MKIVIMDRDGVINQESDAFIKSVAEWHPIPGSIEAIARLTQAGCRVFIASNQSGIGRGIMDFDALFSIHDRIQRACSELGGRIDGIAFAPEHPDQATEMRKPSPGMLRDLAKRLQIGLEGVPYVGDRFGDVQAAIAAGASPVLVRTGKGQGTEIEHDLSDVPIYNDLAAFTSAWLGAQSA